ncbi:MerR family transcriptional regulator [Novosphingobium malaysiense]|uniref:MerR family transcriptional regulator n=2 Tax=Novosphingobium malaysiense TaxID=1348853 RepID=A0A0B1ZVZ4_9SPHN|nr:MerR family transcriptional regulator [Novosphingobium malaysiense]
MSAASAAPASDVQQMLGIHDAAKMLGVTMRTLRFYEDKGLIAPQRVGTTRIYSRREIGRMQLILRGKRLGFSIREIKEFLDLYDVDPEHVEQVRQLRVKVNQRISDLRKQKRAIEQTLEELLTIDQQAQDWLDEAPVGSSQGEDNSRD